MWAANERAKASFHPATASIVAVAAIIAVASGEAKAQSTTTFQLTALSSGNWNSAGVHTLSNYQTGHSNELPRNQAGYFEFNLDPVKGRTLVSNSILIPGSTDYNITTQFHPPACSNNTPCFKIGVAPQGSFSTSAIVSPTSNNNANIYQDGTNDGRNQDLGYAWIVDGLHPGFKFGADHYNPARLQAELNAGGHWVFWSRDRFDSGQGSIGSGVACKACPGGFENYIWGETAYSTGIVMIVTVTNGSATTAVVTNGTYQIRNLNSGLNLEVPVGRTASGTPVDQSTATAANNQQWTVTRLNGGNYTITNVATGLALDVPNAATSPGTAIDVIPYSGHSPQQWALTGTFDGNYTITNAHSGLPLGVAGAMTLPGAGIDQFNPTGNAEQQWSFN